MVDLIGSIFVLLFFFLVLERDLGEGDKDGSGSLRFEPGYSSTKANSIATVPQASTTTFVLLKEGLRFIDGKN